MLGFRTWAVIKSLKNVLLQTSSGISKNQYYFKQELLTLLCKELLLEILLIYDIETVLIF